MHFKVEKKVHWISLFLLLFLLSCGGAVRGIYQMYDSRVDFGKYKTYQIIVGEADPFSDSEKEILAEEVAEALDEIGYKQSAVADLRVEITFDPLIKKDVEHTKDVIAGYFTEGHLFVDMIDVKSEKNIWTGVGEMCCYEDERQNRQSIKKVVRVMFKRFPREN